MRIRQSRLKTIYAREAMTRKDNEGNSTVEYGSAKPIQAVVWPASGKLQTEKYGLRVNLIMNCKVYGNYRTEMHGKRMVYILENGTKICENDGICLNIPGQSEPDYRIIAITGRRFLTAEVEKL